MVADMGVQWYAAAVAGAIMLGVVTAHPLAAAPASFCGEAGWKQVWGDEFSGSVLDNTSWTDDFNGNDSRVRDSLGTRDNVYLEDGALVLRSQRQRIGGYEFTSGAVQTQGLRSWKGHTRVCVRAILPGNGGGNGIWPAHWLMPNDKSCWPSHGEIDIMEMVNGDGITHGTYHWQPNGWCGDNPEHHPDIGGETPVGKDWGTSYHEYAVEYSTTHIAFALDGVVFENITTDSVSPRNKSEKALFFDVPYYIILNTAVGGPWPKPVDKDTVFPTYHRIDYVRVAQPA